MCDYFDCSLHSYASVGGSLEAYGSRCLCLLVSERVIPQDSCSLISAITEN